MKQETTRDDYLNWWLSKYHNTNVEEVINTHDKETLSSPNWFKLYPVTQEQHDEWEKWAKATYKKENRLNKAMLNRSWGFVYLDVAPYVPKNK